MPVSDTLTRVLDEAASPTKGDPASTAAGKPASSGVKALAIFVVTLLVLGSAAFMGYTQWWVPREQAQQRAQVEHQHCLQDVKVYKHKKSYKSRLAQCDRFVN